MYTPELDPDCEERAAAVSRRARLRGAMLLGVGAAALGSGAQAGATLGHASPAPGAESDTTIYSRSAWGARPPRGTIPILNYRPDTIVIHHTATGNVTDYSQSWAFQLSRAIQNWHMDNN